MDLKKLFVCAALGLLLCGCAPQEAAETVEDVYQPVLEQEAQQVLLQVPEPLPVQVLLQVLVPEPEQALLLPPVRRW